MTAVVIGLGSTAKDWFNNPHDLSIGCNDAAKFSKDPDWLVLIDSKVGFKREPERVEIISKTKAKRVFTNGPTWKKEFPYYEEVRLQMFSKHLKKGHVYCSKSSPFVATSLAFNAGAKSIVLFGVDFKSHPLLKKGNKLFDYEMRQWERFCRLIADQGTQVFVSSDYSELSKFLPVWKPPAVNIVGACEKIRREAQELAGVSKVKITAEEHLKRMLE